jgi:SPP1 gp7 family putative phage head morphogenesis protein
VNRYDLAAMARLAGTRRRRAELRPVPVNKAAERAYERVLRAMLREIAAMVRRDVVTAYAREMAAKEGALSDLEVKGIGERFASIFGTIRLFIGRLEGIADQMAGRIFGAEAERHTERFAASVRSAIGINMAHVISTNDLADALSLAAARNAGLIRDLAEAQVNRVSRATMDALARGKTVKQFTADLTREFSFGDKRAALIARNEIGSLNAEMTKLRQEQAGITKYRWSSSQDERTRPLHASLDGTVHEWAKPGPAEDGGHPGSPINCRCVGIGLVEIE